jgi:hypothetical protein
MPLRLSPTILKPMAEVHVLYEVNRLSLWSAGALSEGRFAGSDAGVVADLVGQATLESALLHLRNVADFLVCSRPTARSRETDLVADDYFDHGWERRPDHLFGEDVLDHRAVMRELHRRLAHLSTHRVEGQAPASGFAWTDVIGDVHGVLSAFKDFVGDLRLVHPERASWFRESVASIDHDAH